MTLQSLKDLLAHGEFHHATYRDIGKIWEGLYIYRRCTDAGGFRGFKLVGCFNKEDPILLATAEHLVRHTGISLGWYGNG